MEQSLYLTRQGWLTEIDEKLTDKPAKLLLNRETTQELILAALNVSTAYLTTLVTDIGWLKDVMAAPASDVRSYHHYFQHLENKSH